MTSVRHGLTARPSGTGNHEGKAMSYAVKVTVPETHPDNRAHVALTRTYQFHDLGEALEFAKVAGEWGAQYQASDPPREWGVFEALADLKQAATK